MWVSSKTAQMELVNKQCMKEDELVDISVGNFVAADFPTACVTIIREINAKNMVVTLTWQPALFLLDEFTNNKLMHR